MNNRHTNETFNKTTEAGRTAADEATRAARGVIGEATKAGEQTFRASADAARQGADAAQDVMRAGLDTATRRSSRSLTSSREASALLSRRRRNWPASPPRTWSW